MTAEAHGVECEFCDDSGWRPVECQGDGILCGRGRRCRGPHRFVRRCDCRTMNRTFQERRGLDWRVA